jgi:hypothetical protein
VRKREKRDGSGGWPSPARALWREVEWPICQGDGAGGVGGDQRQWWEVGIDAGQAKRAFQRVADGWVPPVGKLRGRGWARETERGRRLTRSRCAPASTRSNIWGSMSYFLLFKNEYE